MSKLKDLHLKVINILRDNPETRNSDVTLSITLWKKYYSELIFTSKSSVDYIPLSRLYELPREDNIKRIRAKIQNIERKFLPTSEVVFLKRAANSKEWRKFLGYSPTLSKAVYKQKLRIYYQSNIPPLPFI